jgi:serine/threonine-protein kinase
MNTDLDGTAERERKRNDALVACLEAVERGRAADLIAALARHREFAGDVVDFLAADAVVEEVTGPLRSLLRPQTAEQGGDGTGSTLPHADEATPCTAAGPVSFGDYDLLEVLGCGGMGVVYKARQKKPPRVVALKMLRAGRGAAPEEPHRLRAEAEKLARLDHAHIVPVYEVSEHDGQPFFSMRLMEGGSLSRQIEQGPVGSRRAAQWVRQVALAIDHAHQHNIIHRDLKPANIVLDGQDQAHVTDFGLAKRMDGSEGLSQSGIVGTVAYMAPEQADGKATPSSDLHGVGAILYTLLTGRPPFQSETVPDTLEHIRHLEPVAPRLLNPKVDRDLERICLKCLRKDPARRYADAAQLVEDLDAYLAGNPPPHARPPHWWERMLGPMDYHLAILPMRQWSQESAVTAVLLLLTHGAIFVFARAELPLAWTWLALGLYLTLQGLAVWWFLLRSHSAHPAEGHSLATRFAYLLAIPVLFLTCTSSTSGVLAAYPPLTVVTAVLVFIHGSLYWGRCYLAGLAYFVLAVVMRASLEWSPLAYGLIHGGYMAYVSLHIRRQQRQTRQKG